MKRLSVYFTGLRQVKVREEEVAAPAGNQVLVEMLMSAISPGTELLFYRGQAPTALSIDESIASLSGEVSFPLKYGYAAVGRVSEIGAGVSDEWRGRLVFCFNPHESHFLAAPEMLMPVPPGLEPEEAAFLPNMETAVNLVMDGQPTIGEQVVVFGQGIVGLLTTALLTRFPLGRLVTLDRYAMRRGKSLVLGAHTSLDPASADALASLRDWADLAYELSGNPAALDQAIAVTGFAGRVVVGSWYGQKRAALNLGGRFHRSRIKLISSQVSTLAPEWTGRWTKTRRFQTAWNMIEQLKLAQLVTHRFPVERAAEAYALLDEHPEQAIQVILMYT
jgi:2-desacetyl-2-hydroxyethyl bacteriochlorophyllide A dehydrogenase